MDEELKSYLQPMENRFTALIDAVKDSLVGERVDRMGARLDKIAAVVTRLVE